MSLTSELARVIADYDNPESLGSRLRAKRIAPLLEMIEAVHEQCGPVSIVDVGGTEEYWGIVPPGFLDAHNVSITLVNLPGGCVPGSHGRFTINRSRRMRSRISCGPAFPNSPLQLSYRACGRLGTNGRLRGGDRTSRTYVLCPDAQLLVPGRAALHDPLLSLAPQDSAGLASPAFQTRSVAESRDER